VRIFTLLLPALLAAVLLPLSAVAALTLLAGLLFANTKLPKRTPVAWLILAWAAWLPLTLAWSFSTGLALLYLPTLLCLPLGWMYANNIERGQRSDELFMAAFATCIVGLVLWAVLQGPGTFTGKPQGPLNDPNAFAALINLLLLPILANWLRADLRITSPARRQITLALIAGSLFTLFLIASRGATLSFLLVLPALLWLSRRAPDHWRKWSLLIAVSLLAFMTARFVGTDLDVASRLVATLQQGDEPRLQLFKSAWAMVLDHPWLGNGLGSFRLLYPRYRSPEEFNTGGGWVHNDYLQLWLEAGLPMLLLLLALAAWVIVQVWRALREDRPQALNRMGYLAAIAAILIHAQVNFLIYFAPIALLLGIYLARSQEPEIHLAPAQPKDSRAFWLMVKGYALILGLLFLELAGSELFFGHGAEIQRLLWRWKVTYPRYEIAYWLSILNPYDPVPRQTMAIELANTAPLSGPNQPAMHAEALELMEQSQRLAPCFLPYVFDKLNLLTTETANHAATQQAWHTIDQGLACSPRHGLLYYYAGLLTPRRAGEKAMHWWLAGLQASPWLGDRLLLSAMILSREQPQHARQILELATRMAVELRYAESHPTTHMNQVFWSDAQHKLYTWTGKRFIELVKPPAMRTTPK
jgi:O-antigen ligase